jgi:hypothetical protein
VPGLGTTECHPVTDGGRLKIFVDVEVRQALSSRSI